MFGRQPTADQETSARIALGKTFAEVEASLSSAKRYGRDAVIIEVASEEQTGKIGKTRAFADFKRSAMKENPEIVDIRPVTKNHPATFGFHQNAGVAVYLKEPTVARRFSVWMQC
ncbi:MAG TPA: hypothetical protein VL625_05705 [Patescibacteria group bacterium]|nr:hypothetical protein [Patescibacteria group bacterium]